MLIRLLVPFLKSQDWKTKYVECNTRLLHTAREKNEVHFNDAFSKRYLKRDPIRVPTPATSPSVASTELSYTLNTISNTKSFK